MHKTKSAGFRHTISQAFLKALIATINGTSKAIVWIIGLWPQKAETPQITQPIDVRVTRHDFVDTRQEDATRARDEALDGLIRATIPANDTKTVLKVIDGGSDK